MKLSTTEFALAMREMFDNGLIDGMQGSGVTGLKCDNAACDWEDMTIPFEDFHKHVDAPCPKCGENILTQEDFAAAQEFQKIMAPLLQASADKTPPPEDGYVSAHLSVSSDTKGVLSVDMTELVVGADGMVRKKRTDG